MNGSSHRSKKAQSKWHDPCKFVNKNKINKIKTQ
jgi:hypothetical protein